MGFYKKISAVTIFAVGFFIADRAFKFLFLNAWQDETFVFFNFLPLGFYKNYGIAFGLFLPQPVIIFLSLAILGIIGGFIFKTLIKKNFILLSALILISVGALSNLIDRIIYGFVIDYFNFINLNVLNLADCLISLGVFLLLVDYFLCYNKTNN